MNIAPDMWPADTEALRTRITRLEVQSETRLLQVAYWQERARVMEAGRKAAIRTQSELRQEVADERGAVLDLIEQVKIRDAKIQAVQEVHSGQSSGVAAPDGTPEPERCGECYEYQPCPTNRALDVSPD